MTTKYKEKIDVDNQCSIINDNKHGKLCWVLYEMKMRNLLLRPVMEMNLEIRSLAKPTMMWCECVIQ